MKETVISITSITDRKIEKKYRIFSDGDISGFGDNVIFHTNLNSLHEFIAFLLKKHAENMYPHQLDSIEDSLEYAKGVSGLLQSKIRRKR